jgi:inorganic pyrophosphatase
MISRIGLILLLFTIISCKEANKSQEAVLDAYDYLNDFNVYTKDSLVNIIVEIPAGTDQKWEANKDTGVIEWERVNEDSLRVVKYLPYPANYGFIPQTYLPVSGGGDGDPLDVFLLGAAEERGSVVPGRVIGIIKMLDKGEQDDKLIAVSEHSHFGSIKSLSELKSNYPGVLEILTVWLIHYKGNNLTEIQSIEDEQSAMEILNLSMEYVHKN